MGDSGCPFLILARSAATWGLSVGSRLSCAARRMSLAFLCTMVPACSLWVNCLDGVRVREQVQVVGCRRKVMSLRLFQPFHLGHRRVSLHRAVSTQPTGCDHRILGSVATRPVLYLPHDDANGAAHEGRKSSETSSRDSDRDPRLCVGAGGLLSGGHTASPGVEHRVQRAPAAGAQVKVGGSRPGGLEPGLGDLRQAGRQDRHRQRFHRRYSRRWPS